MKITFRTNIWPLTYLLLITVVTSCNNPQRQAGINSDRLALSEVILFAETHFTDEPGQYHETDTFKNYDFAKLKPRSFLSRTIERVYAHYDNEHRIAKLVTNSRFNNSDFEFQFVHNPERNYTIFYANQIFDNEYLNDQSDVVNGFFLVYQNLCFFINFSGPTCIMKLDSELKAITTLKFEQKKLTFRTNLLYSDGYLIGRDVFYKPNQPFLLRKETLVSEIASLFDSKDFTFYREFTIGWVNSSRHLALWIFSGAHEYDYIVKP